MPSARRLIQALVPNVLPRRTSCRLTRYRSGGSLFAAALQTIGSNQFGVSVVWFCTSVAGSGIRILAVPLRILRGVGQSVSRGLWLPNVFPVFP